MELWSSFVIRRARALAAAAFAIVIFHYDFILMWPRLKYKTRKITNAIRVHNTMKNEKSASKDSLPLPLYLLCSNSLSFSICVRPDPFKMLLLCRHSLVAHSGKRLTAFTQYVKQAEERKQTMRAPCVPISNSQSMRISYAARTRTDHGDSCETFIRQNRIRFGGFSSQQMFVVRSQRLGVFFLTVIRLSV